MLRSMYLPAAFKIEGLSLWLSSVMLHSQNMSNSSSLSLCVTFARFFLWMDFNIAQALSMGFNVELRGGRKNNFI